MRKVASLFVVLLLVAAVGAAFAQEKEVVKTKSCPKAGIDSETKIKLEKLKLQYELAMVDIKAEKQKIHGEMMEELLKEEPSTKTLEKLGKSMSSVQYKMHEAKIDYILKVKKVLPADQWKGFLYKQHASKGCSCKGCKCGTGCLHGSSSKGCPMAGVKGHTCSKSCASSTGKAGCEMKCIKIEK